MIQSMGLGITAWTVQRDCAPAARHSVSYAYHGTRGWVWCSSIAQPMGELQTANGRSTQAAIARGPYAKATVASEAAYKRHRVESASMPMRRRGSSRSAKNR